MLVRVSACLPLLLLFAAEGRRRKDVRAQRLWQFFTENPNGLLEDFLHLRKQKQQILQHPGVLRALPGKQEGQFTFRSQRLLGEVDASGIVDPAGLILRQSLHR